MTLNGVMAVTLRYFNEFGKLALQITIFGGIYATCIVFLVRVQCRRKESSRSLSHLLMSFLFNLLLALQSELRNLVVLVGTWAHPPPELFEAKLDNFWKNQPDFRMCLNSHSHMHGPGSHPRCGGYFIII